MQIREENRAALHPFLVIEGNRDGILVVKVDCQSAIDVCHKLGGDPVWPVWSNTETSLDSHMVDFEVLSLSLRQGRVEHLLTLVDVPGWLKIVVSYEHDPESI